MSDYKLLLAFDTDDEEFVRGFEAGRLWTTTEDTYDVDATVHDTNAEMVLRIAEARGLAVRSQDLGDGWIRVTFTETVSD